MKEFEQIKKDAESSAISLGYDTLSLDTINIISSYCNGYLEGRKEMLADFEEERKRLKGQIEAIVEDRDNPQNY